MPRTREEGSRILGRVRGAGLDAIGVEAVAVRGNWARDEERVRA